MLITEILIDKYAGKKPNDTDTKFTSTQHSQDNIQVRHDILRRSEFLSVVICVFSLVFI